MGHRDALNGPRAYLERRPHGGTDALGVLRRRNAFEAGHPGSAFTQVGSECVGYVPYQDGGERSITMHADSWDAVLDGLEEHFSGDAPDSG